MASRTAVAAVFQSTRPHGARRARSSSIAFSFARFNPRARTGRDQPAAPATAAAVRFNPRARTGRDRVMLPTPLDFLSFNPRARTGRDANQLRTAAVFLGFNPRARTGRDDDRVQIGPMDVCFNPRARTGRDVDHLAFKRDWIVFQSTRPHGARRGVVFQPEFLGCVSIHAPARGATGVRLVIVA